MHALRDKLVELALTWEQAFGNAPHITAALSEFDAAQLVGCSIDSIPNVCAALPRSDAVTTSNSMVGAIK